MAVNYEQEIIEVIRTLSDDQKQAALDYLRVLKRPKGTTGAEFLALTKDIRISDEDAAEMMAAIDEAFNEVGENQ